MYQQTRLIALWSVLVICLPTPGRAQEATPPRAVKVLPVFFVPKDETPPTDEQSKTLMRHVEWAQKRYKELLRDRDTFAVAEEKPRVYQSNRPLAFYREGKEGAAPHLVDELLTEWKHTRFNCPYVLLVVVMNPKDESPVGGGRPLNGGINTGGGIIQLSTFAMDRLPNFQSTLQHELGHAFGLPHVDVYGYDMKANDSLMSYNPKHHTKGFNPSDTPAGLIPEDIRGLALNRRAFPKLKFDPAKDVPAGYKIAEKVVPLGPMTIPNHPDMPTFTTADGEDFGSNVANLAKGPIVPNKKDKDKTTFDAGSMWQSGKSKTGWVTVEVRFPYEAELTHIGVHSQHSGAFNAARAVRVTVPGAKDAFRQIALVAPKSADEKVAVPKTKARVWRFEFQAGDSQAVTLRGLRFYSGTDELFPPLVPNSP
ncbi:MAG: hypothetical protein C0467_26820 [Planctomycetaceae bacterium]|nr:hypothetical protein [Planctomycetaceae bacterium]